MSAPEPESSPDASTPVEPRPPSWVLALVGILALTHLLIFARSVLIPVAIALVLYFILSPIVRALQRFVRLPAVVGAGLVLAVSLVLCSYGIYRLAEPAQEWMGRAPSSLRELRDKARRLREPVERVSEAAAEVENLTRMGDDEGGQEVVVQQPSLGDNLWLGTQRFVAGATATALLLYFFLASGERFFGKVLRLLARRRGLVSSDWLRGAERQVSTYLATITTINVTLGVVVAAAMALLGLPNPILWGVMAAAVNFVPYLGPLVAAVILAFVSILTFEHLGRALAPPFVYVALTSFEGMLITPLVLGRRLSLSPVVIILWLFLWSWMWDIVGAFLAVPLLVIVKTFGEHLESLAPFIDLLDR